MAGEMKGFRVMKSALILLLAFSFSPGVWAQSEPDWSEGAVVPEGGRANPYLWPQEELTQEIHAGRTHALVYPVSVTGILLPERPMQNIFDNKTSNPFRKLLNSLFKGFAQVKSYQDLFYWVGLQDYPSADSVEIPYPQSTKPDYLMGYSRLQKNGVNVFTISCAACHASQLFGKTILGMTNRFPRANHFFIRGEKMGRLYNPHWFRVLTGATKAETEITSESVQNLNSIGFKMPVQLGLDTSLAQVALSLDKRAPTPWAEKSPYYEQHPRPDILDNTAGDSKPAVWWNVKYKNRWLSDGSVVAGNPIYTNIIWNEVGRGTDLHKLDNWLSQNQNVIREITTAVFASEAPRIEDFFPAEKIIPERAKRGELLFNDTCSECHGTYKKAWSLPQASLLPWSEQIKTIAVDYPHKTHVKDVGTDPNRYLMMKSLEKLNGLAISKRIGVKIVAQKGYVPPPLVGIWARWPYFHNNSVPSLCQVLTAGPKRVKVYYAGEARDRDRDFDFDCNGYPSGMKIPDEWFIPQMKYDTHRKAMSNQGHDEGIFLENGKEIFSAEDKRDLIQYLQTL